MDEITKDDRFKHIATDSRFRVMKKSDRKFKVDNRFKKMFHDKKFKLKYSVDKRGKPVELSTNDNLKKFYELSESESETEDEEKDKEEKKTDKKLIKKALKEISTKDIEEEEEEDEDEDENDKDDETEKKELDTSDESDDGSDIDDEEKEIPWNEFDMDTERNDNISSRLAICNMDWDRIKAEDLFIMLNSFKTTNGTIKSIKMYLSDFGAERMEYEKLNGPQELTQNKTEVQQNDGDKNETSDEEENQNNNYNDDDDDGEKFDRLKLRTYQFNRLKYYYAVVDCDSSDTANRIYTECDGMEYESSCTRLDLRFIPDDVEFDESRVVQKCLEMPDPMTYTPNLFFTTALNQTKVECTWDETPRDRLAITMKKYTEEDLKTSNFKSILASGSENEDEIDEQELESKKEEPLIVKNKKKSIKKKKTDNDDDDGIQKYKDLLFGQDEKFKKKREADLEFSWEGGIEEDLDEDDDDDDLLVSNKKKDTSKISSKHEKNKPLNEEEIKEQARLSLLTMDADDAGKVHFNLDDLLLDKNQKSKRAKKNKKYQNTEDEIKKDEFELNVNDPRFSAIFFDHKFNIDPSDQSFKKTKEMEKLLNEKTKRKLDESNELVSKTEENEAKSLKTDASAHLLIKSIKSRNEVLERMKLKNKEKQKALKNKLRLLK